MSYSVRTEEGTDEFGKNKHSIDIIIAYTQRTHAPDDIMRIGLKHWLEAYEDSYHYTATLSDLWKWNGDQYQTVFHYIGKSGEARDWAQQCDLNVKRGVWLVDLAYDVFCRVNLLNNKPANGGIAAEQVHEPAILGLPPFLDGYRQQSIVPETMTIPAGAEVVHNGH